MQELSINITIIVISVISNHMVPMQIDTPYINNHMDPCILRHPILAVIWVACILTHPLLTVTRVAFDYGYQLYLLILIIQ